MIDLVACILPEDTELFVLLERGILSPIDTVVGTCDTRHDVSALLLLKPKASAATRGSLDSAETIK
jgi:hypothetical protein